MAEEVKSVNKLLEILTDALTAAKDAFPDEVNSLDPPQDGISLLDVKNELLLSYLQHLVFLILLKLDNQSQPETKRAHLGRDVVRKLIELRAYLDRGVRPLEGRLRYQMDKVLRLAEDAERSAAQKVAINETRKNSRRQKRSEHDGSDVSVSGSESEDGSKASEDEDDSDEDARAAPGITMQLAAAEGSRAGTSAVRSKQSSSRDRIYRPPRQNPIAMPSTTQRGDAEDNKIARQRKNALLDEFINEEHSNAPLAQPSIGSNNTILARGRQHSALNTRDRDRERERTEYEERNLVRLPGASKAERRKAKAQQAREGRDMFGGEDWTGLGGLGDRVSRTVAGGREQGSMLERREKRKRDTTDLPREMV